MAAAATAPLSAALKTGHVGLNVSDLDRSVDFYQEVFGFEVLQKSTAEGRKFVFLGIDGNLIVTLWQQSEGCFSKNLPGLHHLAFLVDDIEQVREAQRRVQTLGGTLHHGGIVPHAEGAQSGGIFFEDPDGIRLEVYALFGAEEGEAPTEDGPTCGFF
jgi:lactoylglutathione lyase